MLWKDVKMEKRSDDEPKFNPQNKTDRKIVIAVIISVSVLLLILAGLIVLYYCFFYRKPVNKETADQAATAIKLLIKK